MIWLAPIAPERDDDKMTSGALLYAQAFAWRAATSGLISSNGGKPPDLPKEARRQELPGKPMLCEMRVKGSLDIKFPAAALAQGAVGAVVFRVSMAPDGSTRKFLLLASIPTPDFGDAVTKAMNTKKGPPFERNPQAVAGCRMDSTDRLVPVIFHW